MRELFGAKKEWTVGPGANLRGANFRGVDLRSVEMTGADLTGAILNEADLAGARLDRAILRDAVLFRAGLAGVSAVGADFRGAILRECELHAADLSDAIIDEWECELAYGDNQTKLPEGRTVTIGAQPDDPDLCDLEWGGGYRVLRRLLAEDSPGQPLLAADVEGTTEIQEKLHSDLLASLVRVLNETVELTSGRVSRVDDDDDEFPSRILWYSSAEGEGRGSPYFGSGLAGFLVRYLNVSFEAVMSDGSVKATFRIDKDAIESLCRHVLHDEHDRLLAEDEGDEAEIAEAEVTVKSVEHFLKEFDDYKDQGFEPNTVTRFWLKSGKRKILIVTVDGTPDEFALVDVEASEHGQEIAESLWSTYDDLEEDPRDEDVSESGWQFELELIGSESESEVASPVDDEKIRQVRQLYDPVVISSCGKIVGFEEWGSGLVMARVELFDRPHDGESLVGPSLNARESLQALLDEAVSAYVLTRVLSHNDLIDDDPNDGSDGDEDEGDESFEEYLEDGDTEDGDVDDDIGDEDEDEDEESDVDGETTEDGADAGFEDLGERFADIVDSLSAIRPEIAKIWGASNVEKVRYGVLDFDVIDLSDDRWEHAIAAARRNEFYLRSCQELVDALGISEIRKIDSHTFHVRMTPCASRRFHPGYEWVPPSRWLGP